MKYAWVFEQVLYTCEKIELILNILNIFITKIVWSAIGDIRSVELWWVCEKLTTTVSDVDSGHAIWLGSFISWTDIFGHYYIGFKNVSISEGLM